jgi:hypothetical protein
MTVLLVRPYPVAALAGAREAIKEAASGELAPMRALYNRASRALSELDPDEVDDWRRAHQAAPTVDALAVRAACSLVEAWEGIVAVGSTIHDPARFRGYAFLMARLRYGGPLQREELARAFGAYATFAKMPFPPDETALHVALPALIGLGPELADELPGPAPLAGTPMHTLLGLQDADWAGLDPLDGTVVTAEACQACYAALPPAWRRVVQRAAGTGLLMRTVR